MSRKGKKLAKEEQHYKPLAYKIKTFARLADLSERFVKQQIYDGELRAVKKGSVWLIPADAADAYLAIEETQGQEVVSQATA